MTNENAISAASLIRELRRMVRKINVNEIADRLNEEKLWNWCGAMREDFSVIIDDLEEYIDE